MLQATFSRHPQIPYESGDGTGLQAFYPIAHPASVPIPPPFAKLVPKPCGAFSGAVPAANDVGDEVSVEHLEATALKVMAAFGWEG